MARDPDAVKLAPFYQTKGRRTKAEKARQLTDTLKGFEATAKGLTRSLDFALPLGLFAFTAWTSRVHIKAVAGTSTFGLYSQDRTVFRIVRPTYQGRQAIEIHFGYDNLYAAEGMGMLTILMSMPGSDIIGLVENGLVLAIYHVFLNGGDVNIPGTTVGAVTLNTALLLVAGPLGLLFGLLTAPNLTATRMHFDGLFQSRRWTLAEMQANFQMEIDAGRLTLPAVDEAPFPLDGFVRKVQADAAIKALAHAAFLTLLLKRGGGVVPTE